MNERKNMGRPKKAETIVVEFRLSVEAYNKIRTRAQTDYRTATSIIREIVEKHETEKPTTTGGEAGT